MLLLLEFNSSKLYEY